MNDRVAFVTGGGRGIGRAICERLAAEGAIVVVADLDGASALQTATAIEASGGRARGLTVDVAEYGNVRDAMREARDALGPIDILVNNAGWDKMLAFVDTNPEFWSRVIDINLRGCIHCCHAVLDQMIPRNAGKIISIASDAARVGSTGESVYAACKGGVISLSKSLARELAPHRINVNAVSPGPTDTPLIQGMVAEGAGKLVDALRRAIPFRRLAEPAEIAGAVAFFASPDADFITGQVLSVSGGLTMAG